FRRSRSISESADALRNLAICALEREDIPGAIELYERAVKLQPHLLPLLIEYGKLLVANEHGPRWLELFDSLATELRQHGRIRLLEAHAALAVGKLATAEKFFDDQVVIADYREGDDALDELWYGWQAAKLRIREKLPDDVDVQERVRRDFPPPRFADFRMKPVPDHPKRDER